MKRALVALGTFVGIPLLVTALLAGGWALVFHLTEETTLPTDDELRLLVSANDLAEFVEFVPRLEHEACHKTAFFDGSYEIICEYDDPSEDAPYLSSELHYEPNTGDARDVFGALWVGARLGMAASREEVAVVPADEFYQWGDQSKAAFITHQDERSGILFQTRHENAVFQMALVGVALDDEDAEDFGALIGRALESIEARFK